MSTIERGGSMSGFADDVGGVFHAYNEYEDSRECIAADLADEGAEEMAQQFRQAAGILEGFLDAAEHVNLGLYLCLSDALGRAKMAHEAAERYAERS